MSYYRSVTIYYAPEKRLEGIEKLKQLAQILSGYGAPTEVLANFSGEHSRIHLVSRFQTLAQFEALNARAGADSAYQVWLQSVQAIFDWNRTTTQLFVVLD